MSKEMTAEQYFRASVMDECFRDTMRRYGQAEIDAAIRKAYLDKRGEDKGVSRKTFNSDIHMMENEYHCVFVKTKIGQRVYYRYNDPTFTIFRRVLTPEEKKLTVDFLNLLSGFDGLPNYNWVGEMMARLTTTFELETEADTNTVVAFEQNRYLKGKALFTPLFNAAVDKQVLKLKYKPFHKKAKTCIIHPYLLKQYNTRWYLIGHDADKDKMVHMAIDRIESVKEVQKDFIENTVDLEERFEDAIGITVPYEEQPVEIVLEVSEQLLPYIETKPINGSQKVKRKDSGSARVSITVYDTYELRSLILSKGKQMKVVQPQWLAEAIQEELRAMIENYSDV